MDAQTFQSRTMARLGDFPSDRQLQRAFGTLISDTSALRSLVSLDGVSLLTDDDVTDHVGALAVALAEAACALGVDLGQAMERGAHAAEERLRSQLALLEQRRAEQRSQA